MSACKNCEAPLDGKYCANCGQKASTRRIVTRDLFKDLLKKLVPWDKGFFYTVRRLVTGPGIMVREYLDGKRVDYAKPLNFLFVVTAISLLVFDKELFLQGMNQQTGQDFKENQQVQQLITWLFSHMSLVMTGLIPFLALVSKLLFRKSGENYAEHLVLNLYMMAGCMVVYFPVMPILQLTKQDPTNPWSGILGILPYLVFFVWGYIQFFKPQNRIWGAFKALLTYGLGYMLYIFAIGIAVSFWVLFSIAE
ncbi:MAG: DUF3667 domain-containing protein [Saprospiraceae bacterium]|nr:DUF3667 domain-containing protein [Saprospiraceae bacterium]